MNDLSKYQTLVFDCDGVVLNSNRLKTDAFYEIGLQFGEAQAQAIVRRHLDHGGVSRYRKFEHFCTHILDGSAAPKTAEELANNYGSLVREKLLLCESATLLNQLRLATPAAKWLIVSGSDEEELRWVFAERKLSHFFDGGIFGSPASKDEIFRREMLNGNLGNGPVLFFGDSRYDIETASNFGLDFIFVHEWTEFSSWQEYCGERNIPAIAQLDPVSIKEVLKNFS